MKSTHRFHRSRASLGLLPLLAAGASAQAQFTGPSTTAAPYVLPSQPDLKFTSVLAVGDSVNDKPDGTPYRMVGIPDGLGAYDNGDGTFTVLMNHELGNSVGVAHAHGGTGAFVSKWVIDSHTLQVVSGSDLIQQVMLWDGSGYVPGAGTLINLGRLCSADLPEAAAFWNPSTGRGTTERIFMNGEEVGAEGRAFGTVVSSGTAFELPALGKFSWENSVPNPGSGDTTLVAGLDDSTPGQVYFYTGQKQDTGNPVERAGLTSGSLWGLSVPGAPSESRNGGLDGSPSIGEAFRIEFYNKGDVSNQTGAQIDSDSRLNGVTDFLRPEDGTWNPLDPTEFFFVTTDRYDQVKDASGLQVGRSRLWKLEFDDLGDLTLGGNLTMLLDGTEAHQMLDNLTATVDGKLLIQEDPGGQDYLARIWEYDLATGLLSEFGEFDADVFAPGAPGFLTRDEESSGIIELTDILGSPSYLFDVQAHYSLGGELVEGGQLIVAQVVPEASTWVAGGLLAAGVGAMAGRRRWMRTPRTVG